MSVNMTLNLKGDFDKVLDKLEADVLDKVLRPSARAGALVYYELMHANVPYKEGALLNAIYHAFITEKETKTYKSYRVGVNHKEAPHWWLVEFGHMFRYRFKKKNDGSYVTLVRPNKMGTPKPSRKSPQSVKDAYYIPLKNPFQSTPSAYIRKSFGQGKSIVAQAMIRRARERAADVLAGRP